MDRNRVMMVFWIIVIAIVIGTLVKINSFKKDIETLTRAQRDIFTKQSRMIMDLAD